MRRLILGCVVLGLIAMPAAAQTNKALEIVPEDAMGFVMIKDARTLCDKLQEVSKRINAKEERPLFEALRKRMEETKGWNEKGAIIAIAMPGKDKDAMMVPVVALPARDHQAMITFFGVKDAKEEIGAGSIDLPNIVMFPFGRHNPKGEVLKDGKIQVLVAKREDYVLVTGSEHRDALQRVLSSKKNIAASLTTTQAWLDEQDIAGICTRDTALTGVIRLMMTNAKEAGADQQKRLREIGQEIEKNFKFIAFGAKFEKEGHSRLTTRFIFQEGSRFAKWLAQAESVQPDLLGGFGDERYLFAAVAKLNPQMNFEGFWSLLPNDPKLPPEKVKELQEASMRLRKRVTDLALSTYVEPSNDKEKKDGVHRAPNLTLAAMLKVDDASAFVEGSTDLITKATAAANAATDQRTEVKLEPKRIGDKACVIVTFNDSNKKTDKEQPGAPTDGCLVFTSIDAKTVLVGVLNKTTEADAFVKQYSVKASRSLQENAELRKTMALMPKQMQIAAFLNLNSFSLMADPAAKLANCPPIGFSFGGVPEGFEAQFVIPFDTVRTIAEQAQGEKLQEPKK
jgi:hypothetical protein